MSYDFPAHESTRKRRRWGCTCGCVMILILMVILGTVAFYLGLKPHEEFPRYAMIDGQTDGFGVLRLNPDDEGAQELTSYLFRRLEKANLATNDENQAKLIAGLLRVSKNFLTQFIQPETMIYTIYNPATADESIIMAAPLKNRAAWGAIRLFVQQNVAPEPVAKNGIAEIYKLTESDTGTTTMLALDPNDMVITDSYPLLTKSLDYKRDETRLASPSEDLQHYIDELGLDQPPEGEDLAVALVNEESRIINMIHVFEEFVAIPGVANQVGAALSEQQLTFSDITGMKITADLASADLLKGEFTLYCPNADAAGKFAEVFEAALERLKDEESSVGFKLGGSARSRGATVVVALELSGIKTWIQQMIPVPETAEKTSAEVIEDAKTAESAETTAEESASEEVAE